MINGNFPVNKHLLTISNLIQNFFINGQLSTVIPTWSTDVNFWYHHAHLWLCVLICHPAGEKSLWPNLSIYGSHKDATRLLLLPTRSHYTTSRTGTPFLSSRLLRMSIGTGYPMVHLLKGLCHEIVWPYLSACLDQGPNKGRSWLIKC